MVSRKFVALSRLESSTGKMRSCFSFSRSIDFCMFCCIICSVWTVRCFCCSFSSLMWLTEEPLLDAIDCEDSFELLLPNPVGYSRPSMMSSRTAAFSTNTFPVLLSTLEVIVLCAMFCESGEPGCISARVSRCIPAQALSTVVAVALSCRSAVLAGLAVSQPSPRIRSSIGLSVPWQSSLLVDQRDKSQRGTFQPSTSMTPNRFLAKLPLYVQYTYNAYTWIHFLIIGSNLVNVGSKNHQNVSLSVPAAFPETLEIHRVVEFLLRSSDNCTSSSLRAFLV
jgi:hypothetical protein